MTFQEKIEYISSKRVLRIEKWRGQNAWRAGIDWYSEKDFNFVCEQPTLEGCIDFLIKNEHQWTVTE